MSEAVAGKRCTVAWATRERQYLWEVELAAQADIGAALEAARAIAVRLTPQLAVPWQDAEVGVFGEPRLRTDPCAAGDRIELYRPLLRDPRQRRRERVQQQRRASRVRR